MDHTISYCRRVVSDRDYSPRLKEIDEGAKDIFARPPLLSIVISIGKRLFRLVRMEWENIP